MAAGCTKGPCAEEGPCTAKEAEEEEEEEKEEVEVETRTEEKDDDSKEGTEQIFEEIIHHFGSIYSVVWSITGRYIATASNDKLIKVISVPNFKTDVLFLLDPIPLIFFCRKN